MRRHRVQKGSLLIEILVAVSIFAVLASIGAQALVVSLNSNVAAEKKTSGANLLSEMMGGIRAVSDEQWQNLYGVTKGSHYYPAISGGKWVVVAGDETVTVGNASYVRYFTVANVSRDLSTRDVETAYTSGHDDPSTQLVSAAVTSTTTDALIVSEYFFRWRNKTCAQTAWSSSGSSGAKNCHDDITDTTYVSATNITAGANLQLCSGGC